MLKEHAESSYSEEHDMHFGGRHQIVRCCGCEDASFRQAWWNDDDYDPDSGAMREHVELYPDPAAGRASVQWSHALPSVVRRMYHEALDALNGGAPTLAAVGLRSLVETICDDQGCKEKKKLHKKIDELVANGVLAQQQADFLHVHRFLGNDAAHEMEAPPKRELLAALDVLEGLMNTIYQLPDLAADLKARRDRRRAKKRTALHAAAPSKRVEGVRALVEG